MMPIYEYECQVCHEKTEQIQKLTGAAPICAGTQDLPHNPVAMNRIFSGHAKTASRWEVNQKKEEPK